MICEVFFVRDRDQRCSRSCIRNWTKFGQKPPVYQICECNKNNLCFKNNIYLKNK